MIYGCMTELIGGTPMLRLNRYAALLGLNAEIIAKLEHFNPAGSVKDRTALNMIECAERNGTLKKGGLIVEPTSGNTGIALAAISAVKGYRAVITMPDNMSPERRKLISAYGAEVVLTPAKEGMAGAISRAKEIAATRGGIILNQFTNPANPAAHFGRTGAEIWEDTRGKIDIFVAGAGTGGTVSGAGEYLKSKNPQIQIVAVEPAASAVISGGKAGSHGIQGIGAGFVPQTLNAAIPDEVIAVDDGCALAARGVLAKAEGIFVGISSGAALCAAVSLARRPENAGRTIAVIFPDGGERYLSSDN